MLDDLPPKVIYIQLIFFVLTLFLCALFSFLETSITALRIFKLKELAKSTNKYHRLFKILEDQPNKILFTILIANNIAHASCTAIITSLMQNLFAQWHFSEGIGLSVGVGISAIAIILFGEIVPKNIAKSYGDKLLRHTLGITNLVYNALQPIVVIVSTISDQILKLFSNGKVQPANSIPTENEIQFLIQYIDEKGLIDPEKTYMLQNVFKLGQRSIKEITIPQSKIIKIGSDATIKEAINKFEKYHFSRLPVFENEKDNIIGIIHLKDILFVQDKNENISKYLRPTIFVPEGMRVNQLLKEFKEKTIHMAIVLNEFGNIEGLATLEDVLEEIVGPIVDEHESQKDLIKKISKNSWAVDATIPLKDLSKELDTEFNTKDAVTLGGFLTERFQRIPQKGEFLIHKHFKIQIQKADNKKVLHVLIFKDSLGE